MVPELAGSGTVATPACIPFLPDEDALFEQGSSRPAVRAGRVWCLASLGTNLYRRRSLLAEPLRPNASISHEIRWRPTSRQLFSFFNLNSFSVMDL